MYAAQRQGTGARHTSSYDTHTPWPHGLSSSGGLDQKQLSLTSMTSTGARRPQAARGSSAREANINTAREANISTVGA